MVLLLALLALPAAAGELALAWPAAQDDLTAGYRVYVGSHSGLYDRVEDVGGQTDVTIQGLQDGQLYYFAVKAYDVKGQESDGYSPEVVSLPSPRIDAADPAVLVPGEATYVTLRGANFAPEVQVRLRDDRVDMRSVVGAGPEAVILLLQISEDQESITLAPADFSVINPGRKAPEFFARHPEAVDLDGSGWVNEADLAIVRSALGSRVGEESFHPVADLDGDGQVDGEDLGRVSSRLDTPAFYEPEELVAAEVRGARESGSVRGPGLGEEKKDRQRRSWER
jgi:hypothetical protein